VADYCPICQRPLLGKRDSFKPERHCPRVDTSILGSVGQLEGNYACLAYGYERQQSDLAQSAVVIKTQDALLGRARQVLVDVGKRLSDALDRFPEEVRGGD